MRRRGYSDALSTGVLAAGGTLGILIPPSIILVIYAIMAEQNIVKMFMAALIPGILAALGYMITVAIYVRIKPDSASVAERIPYRERLRTLGATWPVIVIFGLTMGGIVEEQLVNALQALLESGNEELIASALGEDAQIEMSFNNEHEVGQQEEFFEELGQVLDPKANISEPFHFTLMLTIPKPGKPGAAGLNDFEFDIVP